MENLRIIFAGTPSFAAAHLSAIIQSQHDILAVYTQPDKPSGRGRKLLSSPVKQIAQSNDLTLHQPSSLRNPNEHLSLAKLNADVMVVVAYGLILPKEILDIPKYGCINVHASLLPRWRGAAPIERALLAGDRVSGVTIMQMNEGLDEGDMLVKSEVIIEDYDSRDDLEAKLLLAGEKSLIYTLDNFKELRTSAVKQDSALSCYATKLKKSEFLIDWHSTAEFIHRQVRAGVGRFPAFTFLEGERLRILHSEINNTNTNHKPGTIIKSDKDSFLVQCCSSALKVEVLQLPGKSAVTFRDLINSRPDLFARGKQFDSSERPS